MTKKDDILIARQLKIGRNNLIEAAKAQGIDSPHTVHIYDYAIEKVIDALSMDNSRFDRGKFWSAIRGE